MARRKNTPLEREYQKEVNRIRHFMNRIRKRGYLPAEDTLPERPQNITKKSIQALKKIKAPEIYKRSSYVNKSTGELVSGLEGRAIEKANRKNASKIPKISQDVKRELSRVNRILTPLKKRGYALSSKLPETAEALKKITSKNIYEYVNYTVRPTGKVLTGTEGRKYERSQAAKKAARTRREKKRSKSAPTAPQNIPAITDVVLANIEDEISKWTESPTWSKDWANKIRHNKNVLKNMLNGRIAEEGREKVAQRLQENATEVLSIVERILYESDRNYVMEGVQMDYSRFATIIKGSPLTADEAIELEEAILSNEVQEIE